MIFSKIFNYFGKIGRGGMFDEGFSYMNSFAKVSPGPSAGVQEADEIRGPGSDLL